VLILDATCAGRHLWVDKTHPNVIYVDRRILPPGTFWRRPHWQVRPDVCADFTALPFRDRTFDLVVYDPPHIIRSTPSQSSLRLVYGELHSSTWKDVLRLGFYECWRVLRVPGFLHFKWCNANAQLSEVLSLFPVRPLFKNKHDVTWSVFAKGTAEG
jgi:hypothetical protein